MASDKQIILITGASSGIGYDTSYLLASVYPNNHIIMGVRNPTKGEKALKEIQARNPQGTLTLLNLDVTNDDSIATAEKQLQSEFGRIDVLINNAGIIVRAPTSRDALRSTFETNVFGPTLLTQALLPLLKASKSPKIINISSELGSIGERLDPNGSFYQMPGEVYRMSKAALNMLSAHHLFELRPFGGKVWSFCPGYVITDLTGPEGRQTRKDTGAESSETSAQGILEILEGKRDSEVGKFIKKYGKQCLW